jgi:hypothetical protein
MAIQPFRGAHYRNPHRIEEKETLLNKIKDVVFYFFASIIGLVLLTAFALWDVTKMVVLLAFPTLSLDQMIAKMPQYASKLEQYKNLPQSPTEFIREALSIFKSSLSEKEKALFNSELEMLLNIHTMVALAVLKAYVFSENEPLFLKSLEGFRASFRRRPLSEIEFFLNKTNLENIGKTKFFEEIPKLCFQLHRDKSFLDSFKNIAYKK